VVDPSHPVVAITHMPWSHGRVLNAPSMEYPGYRATVLHFGLREPTGYMLLDVYSDADGYRDDLQFITEVYGVGVVRSEVYPFADIDEGRAAVERLRSMPKPGEDRLAGPQGAAGEQLRNHVVGLTFLPRLSGTQSEAARSALAAATPNLVLRLRFATPSGWLLIEPSLSEQRWCEEHANVRRLYESFDVRIEARLYTFHDRLHERRFDRLVAHLDGAAL